MDYMLHAIIQAALLRLISSYINEFHTDCCSKNSLLSNIFVVMDMAWFRKATYTINRLWSLRDISYFMDHNYSIIQDKKAKEF